jgi:hypothetical protein
MSQKIELDFSKIHSIEVGGIDTRDYPDFCDAYIEYAEYEGREMRDEELDFINDDSDFVYQCVMDFLY